MFPIIAGGAAALSGLAARIAPTVARFIPSFTSNAAGSAGAAAARLRALGHKIGPAADDVVKWVKANPMNALLYGASAVSVGVAVKDIFGDDAEAHPIIQKIGTGEAALAELNAMVSSDSASSVLSYMSDSDEERGVRRAKARILKWAVSHYNGVDNAILAHSMNQAFFELTHADVAGSFEDGLHKLDVNIRG